MQETEDAATLRPSTDDSSEVLRGVGNEAAMNYGFEVLQHSLSRVSSALLEGATSEPLVAATGAAALLALAVAAALRSAPQPGIGAPAAPAPVAPGAEAAPALAPADPAVARAVASTRLPGAQGVLSLTTPGGGE